MKRQTATDLHSVDLKVWRAGTHLKALKREAAQIDQLGLPGFRVEIEREGLDHSLFPTGPTAVPDSFLVTLGDCIHNLRSVLDHLAGNLVRLSGAKPDRVSFPVLHAVQRTNPCTGAKEPSLNLPVTPEIRNWLDSVQPYQRTEVGRRLGILHELDIVDKHRSMLVSAFAAESLRWHKDGENWADANRFPFPSHTWFSDQPLKDGQKCVTATYDSPQLEVNPYLNVGVKILFAGRSPARGKVVVSVLDDLYRLVVSELLPAAGIFFGIDPKAARIRVTQRWSVGGNQRSLSNRSAR